MTTRRVGREKHHSLNLEADPPRRLMQTFHGVWDERMAADAPGTVTWEIEEPQAL